MKQVEMSTGITNFKSQHARSCHLSCSQESRKISCKRNLNVYISYILGNLLLSFKLMTKVSSECEKSFKFVSLPLDFKFCNVFVSMWISAICTKWDDVLHRIYIDDAKIGLRQQRTRGQNDSLDRENPFPLIQLAHTF